jgi:hypothetical protein
MLTLHAALVQAACMRQCCSHSASLQRTWRCRHLPLMCAGWDGAGPSAASTGTADNPFAACMPPHARNMCAPPTSGRIMSGIRNVFGDIMEPPKDGRGSIRGAGPPRPASNPSSAPSSTAASGGMPHVRSGSGMSNFFTRFSAAAGQAAGGMSSAVSGGGQDSLLPPRPVQPEPRMPQMRRQGSFSSGAAAAKGSKGE